MHPDDFEDEDLETNDEVSKSQLKREAQAQQDLGVKLARLGPAQLRKMPLPEPVYQAIREYQRLRANGALRRQMQYIGKLMRQHDTAPVEAALAALENRHQQNNAAFHRLERLRDQLVAAPDDLDAVLELYPGADRQHLRQLARNAHREKAQESAPKAGRALFKYLRELEEGRGG